MKRVVVTWHDAWFDSGETKPSDWDAVCVVQTAGWVLPCPEQGHDSCDAMHIAGERFKTSKGYYRSVTHIPRGMVIEVV